MTDFKERGHRRHLSVPRYGIGVNSGWRIQGGGGRPHINHTNFCIKSKIL